MEYHGLYHYDNDKNSYRVRAVPRKKKLVVWMFLVVVSFCIVTIYKGSVLLVQPQTTTSQVDGNHPLLGFANTKTKSSSSSSSSLWELHYAQHRQNPHPNDDVYQSDFTLTIAVTGDMHGHFTDRAARLSTFLQRLHASSSSSSFNNNNKKKNQHFVVLLDAGDATFPGNETLVARTMNRLGYRAMVVGNHEFDIGWSRLQSFRTSVDFPILASNVDGFPSHAKLELWNGDSQRDSQRPSNVTLCVVGVTANEPNPLASPNLHLRSEQGSLQDALPKLLSSSSSSPSSSSCTRTVLLSHAGIQLDAKLLQEHSQTIDVVLGGHSHVLTPLPTQHPDPVSSLSLEYGDLADEKLPPNIVHTGSYGGYVGLVRMEWNRTGNSAGSGAGKSVDIQTEVLPLETIVDPDPEWKSLPEEGTPASSLPHADNKIRIHMEGSRICAQPCRSGDCLLGNVVTDSMREFLIHYSASDPSFQKQRKGNTMMPTMALALLESGTLRNCLLPLYTDFSEILPWPNKLVLLQLRAGTIRKMLHHGIQRPNGGAFLQVSGLEYRYTTNGTVQEMNLVLHGQQTKRSPVTATTTATPADGVRRFEFSELSGASATKSCQVSESSSTGGPMLEPHELYWVVVTDWLASGGDGFGPFVAEAVNVILTNTTIHDAIRDHATSEIPPFQPSFRSSPTTLSSAARSGIAGFLGGAAAFLLTFPLYTMFVRKSMARNFACSLRLLDGVTLGTLATAVSDAIFFMVYTWIPSQQYSNMTRSYIAAFTNSLATTPLWVIVTHKQLASTPISIWKIAKDVYKYKGVLGYFDSISMNVLMCIFPVIRQMTLECLVRLFSTTTTASPAQVAVAATLASIVATIATYPIQKARILLQSGERPPQVDGILHFCCGGIGFKLLDTCCKTFILFLVKEQSDIMLCILEG